MSASICAPRLLQPEVYVFHATGALASEFYRMRLPEMARAFILRQFQNNARESIQAILSETSLASRQLAIETIEFPFELTVELAEQLDLSMCLDTGHVLVGFPGRWICSPHSSAACLAWPRSTCTMARGKGQRNALVTARITSRLAQVASMCRACSTG